MFSLLCYFKKSFPHYLLSHWIHTIGDRVYFYGDAILLNLISFLTSPLNFFYLGAFFNYLMYAWAICFVATIFFFLTISVVRWKFCLFFILLCLFSAWGFYYNMSGVILLFLLTEILLLFIFYVSSTQQLRIAATKHSSFLSQVFTLFLVLFFAVFSSNNVEVSFSFCNFYSSLFFVTSSDFFLFFLFFFYLQPFITFCLIIVLGVFSIFFILFYFSLKNLEAATTNNTKGYTFLRRQNFAKQAFFQTFVRIFSH